MVKNVLINTDFIQGVCITRQIVHLILQGSRQFLCQSLCQCSLTPRPMGDMGHEMRTTKSLDILVVIIYLYSA